MDLAAIQRALSDAGIDGWLFYDFHHRDLMAYNILGLDAASKTTRRWFYFIPSDGEPTKLAHKVEPAKLDPLPGITDRYLAWTELREKLGRVLEGRAKVAMQYSPMANIPSVSVVDAGTIELVQSLGPQVVSSADLVQQFEAVTDAEGYRSHCEAGALVQGIKDEAFALMDDALRGGKPLTEFDVAKFILSRFEEEGLAAGDDVPIVGFNDHPADPHFEPTAQNAHTLKAGDTILLDLWARRREPPGLFYDITWCGFAGQDPPKQYLEIWDVVCLARDTALEFVRQRFREGRPCYGYEVDDVARGVIADAGYADVFVHRTGHSIGVDDVHGNGANIDNLETRDERQLVPGICFSIEPGIYLEGKMAVRTEIDVFITPDGDVEVYGPIQRELLLIG